MAGKKGRSGPPGNLNNVAHPWRSFWARRAHRQQDKWIVPLLNRYLDEAIEDAGGDDISSGKRASLEIAQVARGCSMLCLRELKEKGFTITTPDGWDMNPGLKELSRFLALELTARRNVGLGRIKPSQKEVEIYEPDTPAEGDTKQPTPAQANGSDENGQEI
jgi:hypothetical protein